MPGHDGQGLLRFVSNAAGRAALDAKIDAQKLSYEADDLTEKNRAIAAEAALQLQISNILNNSDAVALNSLAEVVTSFTNADSTLTGALALLQSSFDDLKDRVDALTDNS